MAASAREEMMSNDNPGVTWQHLHQTRPDQTHGSIIRLNLPLRDLGPSAIGPLL